jgi:P-type conjugative transfer protein TrbJ
MKSWLASLGIILVLSTRLESVQAADAVMCVNCSSEVTQLASKLTMLKQLATQAQQLKAQLNQYQNMVMNTKGVSNQLWGNALGDLQKVNSIIQQSRALAYSAKNLDTQFAQRYQGYNGYVAGRTNSTNKYNQWSQEGHDNALYALKAAGAQNVSLQDENALMAQIQSMAGSATGRMQALQLGNMMASQNIQQIQKLRQLVMTQIQMEANYYQMQQDKADAMQAEHQRFINNASTVPSNDGRKF